MKKIFYATLFLGLFSGFLLVGSQPLHAQTLATDSVSMGPNYAQDVWYSLSTGEVARRDANNWDLAFQVEAREAGIRVNEIKGVALYLASTNFADFETVDTTGKISEALRLHNSDTSWNHGAFNSVRSFQNPFDYGWGLYDQPTNTVSGTKVYFLKLADTSWHKIRILTLTERANVFTLERANLDNSNRDTFTVDRRDFTGKRFGYWSFATNATLDREPAAAAWDLKFTRYYTLVQGLYYPVAGVLANYSRTFFGGAGVTSTQVNDADTSKVKSDNDLVFNSNISILGADWKSFDNNTFQWNIADDIVYFVRDLSGKSWRIVFTGFGGGTNGTFVFNRIPTPTSRNSLAAAGLNSLNAWPNPSAGELNLDATATQLSGNVTISVSAIDGRLIEQHNTQATGNGFAAQLQLKDLPTGLYLVSVQPEGRSAIWLRWVKTN